MIMNTRLRISRFFAAATALVLAVACAATAASAAGVATGSQNRGDRATQLLFDAVHTNDFAAAEAAVAAGADVEARDRWDISTIELAIDKGYFRIAHFLVSVRNSRAPAGEAASQAREQASPGPAPAQAQAAAAPAKRVAVVPPAKAAAPAQKAAAQPQWPADKPNPFDPAAPAFGTALPVVPAQAAAADAAANAAARTDDGPMLATDEPIRRSSEALR